MNPCGVQSVVSWKPETVFSDPCPCEATVPNTTCPSCGRPVFLDRSPTCRDCWYSAQVQSAEDRFGPLTAALARELEVTPDVDQTGGMIMCLGIHFPDGAWIWFSDWDDFDVTGFGMYATAEDEGDYRENEAIPYLPENAEAIARWAAPIIMEFASKHQEAAA
jgi:hypothetical protein